MADRLTTLAFATAHVGGLGVLAVLLLHWQGALGGALEPLSTTVGVALFLALWAITLATHHWGFRLTPPWSVAAGGLAADATLTGERSAPRYVAVGGAAGAVTGAGFFVTLVGGTVVATIAGDPSSLTGVTDPTVLYEVGTLLALVLSVGTVIALTVGAVVGLATATMDVLLVGVVGRLTDDGPTAVDG
ncbi:hypothetical protein JCM17823_18500 [Halorubrum gandharaense]